MQFALTSSVWRVVAGFLAGNILTAIGYWVLFASKNFHTVAEMLFYPLVMPVTSVLIFPNLLLPGLPESALVGSMFGISYVFWPLVLAVAFGLGGARQTRMIVVWEIIAAVVLAACYIGGWALMGGGGMAEL